jgi:hypothetical protein
VRRVAENAGKKNRGRMAPEQQRQEENGDAAALPHTYRKDRQRDFPRVRNIFRVDRGLAESGRREALKRPAAHCPA